MSLYQQIKHDLQQGRFAPGTVLKQTDLAECYNVSRIPVRDALQRLKSEGWLCAHGKRGIAVPQFDAREAEDLYLMRMRLEPLLLTFAAERLNSEILGRARDILERMDHTPGLAAAEIGALNREFHACLYSAAERQTLFATVAQLQQQCERYIGYQSRSLDYQHTSQREHYAILEALQRGDVEGASRVLEQHISSAGRALVDYLNGRPE
ncbi:GntR family transcriptional regulator [Microbulbifer sp. SA54]|uniref:GntR family transcriptional regulator n=1 Tax=Microbulbifer sp. SA54 TaxID=3401577 RepID=UPI003AAC7AC1